MHVAQEPLARTQPRLRTILLTTHWQNIETNRWIPLSLKTTKWALQLQLTRSRTNQSHQQQTAQTDSEAQSHQHPPTRQLAADTLANPTTLQETSHKSKEMQSIQSESAAKPTKVFLSPGDGRPGLIAPNWRWGFSLLIDQDKCPRSIIHARLNHWTLN